MAITIKEFNTPNQITLDSFQQALFEDELKRVRGTFITQWISNLVATRTRRVRPIMVQPDCEIMVNHNGQITKYFLHGEYVLYQEGSPVNYQFYMGVLLQQWLGMP
ncbi:hypothetical protein M0C34_14985 [Agarivorans sp. TSD2052]|uniref:hypothetical protein n=1 Tax=Agarivorans sp. TSD2052 TaxID=2937286 RepID=UPI00200C90C4|nr:hypothetical protein [Agarivorans sp. TSD2052]UPW17533.1 hypothetical protein M0C34_14985 [Agarivorans sp. TSD2052]